MSYSRWSTPLGLDTRQATGETDPTESYIAWHSMSQADRMAELNRQGAILSEWYIYWDTASDQSLGRNGQLLAIWHAGTVEYPPIDYQELRRIADRDAWHLIPGYEQTSHPLDRQNVRNCVHEWLADVEDEHPDVAPLTRREMAEHYQRKAQARIQDADAGDHHAILPAYSAVLRMKEIALRAADSDPDAHYIASIALIARTAVDASSKVTARRLGGIM